MNHGDRYHATKLACLPDDYEDMFGDNRASHTAALARYVQQYDIALAKAEEEIARLHEVLDRAEERVARWIGGTDAEDDVHPESR